MITAETITDEQIFALRADAANAADGALYAECNLALAPRLGTEIDVAWDGRKGARRRLAEYLNARSGKR